MTAYFGFSGPGRAGSLASASGMRTPVVILVMMRVVAARRAVPHTHEPPRFPEALGTAPRRPEATPKPHVGVTLMREMPQGVRGKGAAFARGAAAGNARLTARRALP